jgi:hypothetical protein
MYTSAMTNFDQSEVTELLIKAQENDCSTDLKTEVCTKLRGRCVIHSGYAFYFITLFLILFGVLWFFTIKKTVRYLENVPNENWKVSNNKKIDSSIKIEDENNQEQEEYPEQ